MSEDERERIVKYALAFKKKDASAELKKINAKSRKKREKILNQLVEQHYRNLRSQEKIMKSSMQELLPLKIIGSNISNPYHILNKLPLPKRKREQASSEDSSFTHNLWDKEKYLQNKKRQRQERELKFDQFKSIDHSQTDSDYEEKSAAPSSVQVVAPQPLNPSPTQLSPSPCTGSFHSGHGYVYPGYMGYPMQSPAPAATPQPQWYYLPPSYASLAGTLGLFSSSGSASTSSTPMQLSSPAVLPSELQATEADRGKDLTSLPMSVDDERAPLAVSIPMDEEDEQPSPRP